MRTRRAFGDVAMSIGALLVLLLALVSIDDRVREQVSLRISSGRTTTTELVAAGTKARNLADVMFEAARDQSIEHAPLVIFVTGAVVLLVFMLRM